MPAINPVAMDSLVTVKVSYEGNIRRFKLGLKDVGPTVFQDNLRALLSVPKSQPLTFERYSDSAGCFVTLDPENTAVYRQLFRAAKAKLKLRIKVTTISVPPEGSEETTPVTLPPPSYSSVHLNQPPTNATVDAQDSSPAPQALEETVSKAVADYCSGPEFTTNLRVTIQEEVKKFTPSSIPAPEPSVADNATDSVTRSESCNQVYQIKDLFFNTNRVYCDICNNRINGVHYHCAECDHGDYDICDSCASLGNHCKSFYHNLVKREISNGTITHLGKYKRSKSTNIKCSCCEAMFPELKCVTCLWCDKYNLCIECLRRGTHGHDARHQFGRVNVAMDLIPSDEALLAPGRNFAHTAVCDGCDRKIYGIRYKCIDCPDWDYCNECIGDSERTHPRHRFVSVLDRQSFYPEYIFNIDAHVFHRGVLCDGPLCKGKNVFCIKGVRYKCTVCPNTDFCDKCEASPINEHNATHPLIKLKQPIRTLMATAVDDNKPISSEDISSSFTEMFSRLVDSATQVQPSQVERQTEDQPKESEYSIKEKQIVANAQEPKPSLCSRFIQDFTGDNTVTLNLGGQFTQFWLMRNTGPTTWPPFVTVKFVGGDDGFFRSEEHNLISSTMPCEVLPSAFAGFSVRLTPTGPPNKVYTSYWRLISPSGLEFGDKIRWCVKVADNPVKQVEASKPEESPEKHDEISYTSVSESASNAESVKHEEEQFEDSAENILESQTSDMVFPKLPVESPVQSLEQLPSSLSTSDRAKAVTAPGSPASDSSHKTFALSENGDIGEEIDISSLDSVLTDDEYDVLHASDEDFEQIA